MAKKEEEIENGELDDFDFDFPDTDIPGDDGSRKPITQLSSSFAGGVKDDLMDHRQINRRLKKALPESYSTSIDLADDTAKTVGDLYNTIAKESRQGVRDVKRLGRTQMEKHGEKMPGFLRNRLDKLLKSDDPNEGSVPTPDQIRDSEINNTVSSIFQLSAAVSQQEGEEEKKEAKQSVRDRINQLQNQSLAEHVRSIRMDVGRQVTRQDQIESRYQAKMLELQYRQFFTTRDLLSVTEGAVTSIKEALQAIVKNTAMPDYQKLQFTEAGGAMLRDQMLEGIQNSVMDLGGDTLKNFRSNLIGNVKSKVAEYSGMMSELASTVDMASDSGVNISPYEIVGQGVGSAASQRAVEKLSPKVREFIQKNPNAAALGLRLQNFGMNLPRLLNEWADKDFGYGISGGIMNALAGVVEKKGLDPGLNLTGVENSKEPAIFDSLTRKSINEIIPGYLSRIHHELRAFREGMGAPSGDPDDRLTYDLKTRAFGSKKSTVKSVRDDIFRPEETAQARNKLDELYGNLDIDQYVDQENKGRVEEELNKYITQLNLNGRTLDITRLAKSGGSEDISEDVRGVVAEALRQRYNVTDVEDAEGRKRARVGRDQETQKQIRKVNSSFLGLTNTLNDPKRRIEAYAELGYEDQLRELNFIKDNKSGRPEVNYDTAYDVIDRGGYVDQNVDQEYVPGETVRLASDDPNMSSDERRRVEAERRRYNRYLEDAETRRKLEEDEELQRERKRRYEKTREGRFVSAMGRAKEHSTSRAAGLARKVKPNLSRNKEDPNAISRADSNSRGVDFVPPEAPEEKPSLFSRVSNRVSRLRGGVPKTREEFVTATNQVNDTVRERVGSLRDTSDQVEDNSVRYTYIEGAPTSGNLLLRGVPLPQDDTDQSRLNRAYTTTRDQVVDGYGRARDAIDERFRTVREDPRVKKQTERANTAFESGRAKTTKVAKDVRGRIRPESQDVNEPVVRYVYLGDQPERPSLLNRPDNIEDTSLGGRVRSSARQINERATSAFDETKKKKITDDERYQKVSESQAASTVRGIASWFNDRFTRLRNKTVPDENKQQDPEFDRRSIDVRDTNDRVAGGDDIGRLMDDPLSTSRSDDRNLSHPQDSASTASGRVQQEVGRNRKNDQNASLYQTVRDVRDILTSDSEGIGRRLDQVYDHLTRAEETGNSQEAQYAVLCRILETVEALGRSITSGDSQAANNLGETANKSKSVLSKIGSGLGSYYAGAFSLFGGMLGGAGGVASGTGRAAGNLIGKAFGGGRRSPTVDIYVAGRPQEPALRADRMRKKEYRDSETGKVIKSIDDLKKLQGNVLNKNDVVVATAGELSEGIYDRLGNPLGGPGVTSSLKDTLTNLTSSYMSITTAPMRAVGRGVANTYRATKDYLSRTPNVYVKGEQNPRLIATVMRNGGYINASTGQPILSLDEIDGDVKDLQGNTVLPLADQIKGLVDKNGRPLKFMQRQIDRAKDLIKAPFKAARWTYDKASEGVQSLTETVRERRAASDKIRDAVEGGLNEDGSETEQLKVIKEIRDIVKRFEKKKVFGDRDGDGDRDNSWKDIFQRRKAEESAKDKRGLAEEDEKPEKSESLIKRLLPYILPAMSLIGTQIKNVVSLIGDGFGAIIDKLLDLLAAAGMGKGVRDMMGGDRRREVRKRHRRRNKVRRRNASRGAWDRLKNRAPKAARRAGGKSLASRAAPWLGRGAALAASFVSLPVLATGALVAGAAVGGYYLWKKYNEKDLGELVQHRMMQYGIDPNESEQTAKILWLEDRLKDNVKVEQNGRVDISFDDITIQEMVDQFGGDAQDQNTIDAFSFWFNQRFLPVYLAAKQGQNVMVRPKSLAEIDAARPQDKLDFFKQARKISPANEEWQHPYAVIYSPFNPQARLTVPVAKIQSNGQALINKLSKAVAEEKEKTPEVMGSKLPLRRMPEPRNDSNLIDRVVKPARDQGNLTSPSNMLLRDPNAEQDKRTNMILRDTAEVYTVNVSSNIPGLSKPSDLSKGQIKPQMAMLYKAMGLVELEADKVKTLDSLIDFVLADVQIDGHGKIHYTVDTIDVFNQFQGQFGIFGRIGGLDRQRWIRWFETRFLPVLLNFIEAVRDSQASARMAFNQVDSSAKKGVTAGEVLKSLETIVNGEQSVSVWAVSYSPWPKYRLNNDPSSINSYIQHLKSQVKEKVVGSIGEKTKTDDDDDSKIDFSDKESRDKLFSELKKNREKAAARLIAESRRIEKARQQGLSTSANDDMFGIGDLGTGAKDKYDLSGGSSYNRGPSVVHPGGGTGGDVNELPMPDGKEGWPAYQKLIVQASRMAGVDPGLMATMAAIESNFRGGVKAPTSSAKGVYQFIDSTWKEMLQRYGSKYGISKQVSQYDPRANVLMGAEFLKQNQKAIKDKVNGNVTDTDLYAAHFLGAGGARILLSADPSADATSILPKAAGSNPSIFKDKKGRRRSVAGVYKELERRVSTRRDLYADQARDLAGSWAKTNNADEALAAGQGNETPVEAAALQGGGETPQIPNGMSGFSLFKTSLENDGDKPNPAAGASRPAVYRPPVQEEDNEVEEAAKSVQKARERRQHVAATQDRRAQQRNESEAQNMSSISEILTESLETQKSMDKHLGELVEINKTQQKQQSDEFERTANRDAEIAEADAKALRRKNRPNLSEEGLSNAVVDMSRRRAS